MRFSRFYDFEPLGTDTLRAVIGHGTPWGMPAWGDDATLDAHVEVFVNRLARYPDWVREAVATHPEWVESRLTRNPQWINEQLKQMSVQGDLFA